MFPITRLAAKATKIERAAVKKYTKFSTKVGLDTDSALNTVREAIGDRTLPGYSKNIFKRAMIWVSRFVDYFSEFNVYLKTHLRNLQASSEVPVDKKTMKAGASIIVAGLKEKVKETKNILNETFEKIKGDFSLNEKESKFKMPEIKLPKFKLFERCTVKK